MAWQARVAPNNPSPAQRKILETSDWLLKGSTGGAVRISGGLTQQRDFNETSVTKPLPDSSPKMERS